MKNSTQDKLAWHIAAAVESWPPLTREQLDRVAVLLRPGGSGLSGYNSAPTISS